jgi:hypothetical protein
VLALWLSGAQRASTSAPPATQPVLTRDADHPGRRWFFGQIGVNNDSIPEGYTLPILETETLIVDFVSATCTSTGSVHHLAIGPHVFAPLQVYPGEVATFAVFTQPTRMNIFSGEPMPFGVFPTSSTPTTSCTVNFSGYVITQSP